MNLAPHPGSTWRPPAAWWLAGLWLLLGGAGSPRADAYVLDGYHWPAGQPIVLNLQLSPLPLYTTLLDGSTSYNQVAQAAMDVWNPYLGSDIQFEAAYGQFAPAQRDGANSVYSSSTVDGEALGSDTLAVTLSFYNKTTRVKDEADVIVSSLYAFSSYRGSLRGNDFYDLRRVLIHEFGHVLGLEHVDQSAQSIMTPVVTDIDTIQADDIAGVAAIYGPPTLARPVIDSPLSSGAVVGQPYQYQIMATNYPTIYGVAAALPAGLVIDMATGLISGTPLEAGTFNITIEATNGGGTGMATLVLTFDDTPVITNSPAPLTLYAGYPFSYQITAIGEPASFSASGLPAGLTLNTATGYISGTPTEGGAFTVSLAAVSRYALGSGVLTLDVGLDAALTILHVGSDGDGGLVALILGGDSNLYGMTRGGGANGAGTLFKLTPDGVLTTLHDFSVAEGSPSALLQGRDGNFYGATDLEDPTSFGALFKFTPDGTLTMLSRFATAGGTPRIILTQGADGDLYGTISYAGDVNLSDFAGSVFKFSFADGTLTTLHSFGGADGYRPSGLIQGKDGNFYGATDTNLDYGSGTIYKVTPDGVFTLLHRFSPTEGTGSDTPLTLGSDGNLYGIAQKQDVGAVFRSTTDGTLTVFASATSIGAALLSVAPLLQGADGSFYGLAGYGLSGGPTTFTGALFKVAPDGTPTILDTLENFQGIAPGTALLQDKAGVFYGAFSSSASGGWTVFKRVPVAPPVPAPPANLPTVVLGVTAPAATVGSGEEAECTVTLSAPQTTDTVVYYTVKGTGINGTDYARLPGTKKIKAGKTSKKIKIIPQGDLGGASKKTVVLALVPSDSYTVGATSKAKVKLVAP